MITVSLADIKKSQSLISSLIKRTPLTRCSFFSKKTGVNLFLKWENEQEIKSFKIRGALNKILSLDPEKRKNGLIAASAGNHAQGVALAAHYTKTKARVVMMEQASKTKVVATKKWGAEVILKGKTYDESYHYARSVKGDSTFIHAFADSLVIAGQGTVALEILEDLPEMDSIIIPIGGGGLVSGVALAVKSLKPDCKIYGVVWDGTPNHCRSFHRIPKEEVCFCGSHLNQNSISRTGLTDGIAVKIPKEGMFPFFSSYVDDIVCINEKSIAETLSLVLEKKGKVLEGSGVASLAAVLENKKGWNLGKNCCVIISGGNIDSETFNKIVNKENG